MPLSSFKWTLEKISKSYIILIPTQHVKVSRHQSLFDSFMLRFKSSRRETYWLPMELLSCLTSILILLKHERFIFDLALVGLRMLTSPEQYVFKVDFFRFEHEKFLMALLWTWQLPRRHSVWRINNIVWVSMASPSIICCFQGFKKKPPPFFLPPFWYHRT